MYEFKKLDESMVNYSTLEDYDRLDLKIEKWLYMLRNVPQRDDIL